MVVLGIGTGVVHDSSACLFREGRLVAAAEEERFTRKKHQEGYPAHAIRYCLEEAGLGLRDVDHVAIHFRPWMKYLWSTAHYIAGLRRRPARSAYYMALELSPKLVAAYDVRHRLRKELRPGATLRFVDHHLAHAASCFHVSPFEEAAILTLDNRGERDSATLNHGRGTTIQRIGRTPLPHSLGMLYATFTGRYLGFGPFDEYKVMGLASYGKPRFIETFRRIVRPHGDGSFRIDRSYFEYEYQGQLGKKVLDELGPARREGEPLDERFADVAASLQCVLEEIAVSMAKALHARTGSKNLCLAGGVALNGVMNARIMESTPFENVFIQPAASDAGCALGAALYVQHHELGHPRSEVMEHAYWGPAYSDAQIRAELDLVKVPYKVDEQIARTVASLVADGKIVGWFQGRMEWGPRALGARSILADPRRAEMKDLVNRCVKYREEFRPFAPAVLAERAGEFFEPDVPSPFMVLVQQVRPEKRSVIPAVTHVDGTARVQTVERRLSPLYYEMIEELAQRTGVPVVLNTSFNVKGEPIVCTPLEAVRCFYGTGLDALAIGNTLLRKA